MENSYYSDLIKARIERGKELVIESEELVARGAYKSANNRAYYAIEKAVKSSIVPH